MILFSGYNDFVDARKAISIGVTEYLMKPVDPEEFRRTMEATLDMIAADRTRDREALFVRRHLLYLALSRDAESIPSAQERAFVGEYGLMLLLEFQTDFFAGDGENFELVLHRFMPGPCDFISLYPEQGLILLRRPCGGESPEALAEAARRFVQNTYGHDCAAACEVIDGADDFLPAYRRLEARTDRGTVILPGKDVEFPMEQMLDAARQGDILLLRDNFDAAFTGLRMDNMPSSLYAKFCVTQLISELLRLKGNPSRESDIVERVFACANLDALKALVYDALRAAQERADALSNQKIEAIKRYICQHFSEDIGLEDLARTFYFSPNYLCRLFKHETGCTPGKFLNDYRMKKAQELLEGSQMKVSRISQAVGFKSSSYFCQRFRDRFGVSPELYRQGILRMQDAQEGQA